MAEYHDEAASAYHGNRGPGLAKAREHAAALAAEHGGCVLAVQHTDRLARGDAGRSGDAVGAVVPRAIHERIAERLSSAGAQARETVQQHEREHIAAEAALARVRRHYQEGRIEPEDWTEQRHTLSAAVEAARGAVEAAQEHAEAPHSAPVADVERQLLDHLAALKRALPRAWTPRRTSRPLRNTERTTTIASNTRARGRAA